MVSSATLENSVCCRFDEFDVTAFFVVSSTSFKLIFSGPCLSLSDALNPIRNLNMVVSVSTFHDLSQSYLLAISFGEQFSQIVFSISNLHWFHPKVAVICNGEW